MSALPTIKRLSLNPALAPDVSSDERHNLFTLLADVEQHRWVRNPFNEAITNALVELKLVDEEELKKPSAGYVPVERAKAFFPFPEKWKATYFVKSSKPARIAISFEGLGSTTYHQASDLAKLLRTARSKFGKPEIDAALLRNGGSIEAFAKESLTNASYEDAAAAYALLDMKKREPHAKRAKPIAREGETDAVVKERIAARLRTRSAVTSAVSVYEADGLAKEEASVEAKGKVVSWGQKPIALIQKTLNGPGVPISDGLTTKTEVRGLTLYVQCGVVAYGVKYRVGNLAGNSIWWTPWYDDISEPVAYHMRANSKSGCAPDITTYVPVDDPDFREALLVRVG